MNLLISGAIVILGMAGFVGFKFYLLMRARTIRVRIIMPDGRSSTYLTRITRDGDIRVNTSSYQYDDKCLTFEGALKIPTLEYLSPSRKPLPRRAVPKSATTDLTPEAAYDGITSHVMRELLKAFAEDFVTTTLALIVTVIVVVAASGAVYYQLHKDSTTIQNQLGEINILLIPTPTIPTSLTPLPGVQIR